MFDLFNNLLGEAQDLVLAAVVLIAIGMVLATWVRTKAFVPTIGAIIFGAFVIWAVRNVDFFEEQIGEDITEAGASAVVGGAGG
jgi:hypothetical protein